MTPVPRDDAADIAGVLAQHVGCIANPGSDNSGSGQTGVDVWSCGIRVPFLDDLEDAERAHLAAALIASPVLARLHTPPLDDTTQNGVRRIVNAWDCCGTCAGGVFARIVQQREQAARDAALAPVEALASEWERIGGDNPGAIGLVMQVRDAIRDGRAT